MMEKRQIFRSNKRTQLYRKHENHDVKIEIRRPNKKGKPMSRPQRREKKLIMEAGHAYLNDDSMPVSKRIRAFQQFLREFRVEKEKLTMKYFKEQNGFEATDDDSKRALVDRLIQKAHGSSPKDDEERNSYVSASYGSIMKIGWTPHH
jgi:hypothetical protein